jgi:hypothetical protein
MRLLNISLVIKNPSTADGPGRQATSAWIAATAVLGVFEIAAGRRISEKNAEFLAEIERNGMDHDVR